MRVVTRGTSPSFCVRTEHITVRSMDCAGETVCNKRFWHQYFLHYNSLNWSGGDFFFSSILWVPSAPFNLMSHFWDELIWLSCLADVNIRVLSAWVTEADYLFLFFFLSMEMCWYFQLRGKYIQITYFTAAGELVDFYDTRLPLEPSVRVMQPAAFK